MRKSPVLAHWRQVNLALLFPLLLSASSSIPDFVKKYTNFLVDFPLAVLTMTPHGSDHPPEPHSPDNPIASGRRWEVGSKSTETRDLGRAFALSQVGLEMVVPIL